MDRKLLAALVCASLLYASLACKALSPSSDPTPTPTEPVPVVEATAAVAPTATVDAAATSAAAEKISKATEQAATETAAEEAARAATKTASAKLTQQAAAVIALTQSVKAQATQQAADMYSLIEALNKDGAIKGNAGTYNTVEDFKESWAQIGWYQWWATGLEPSNFVLRANTTWESASKTADWWSSGCGFVFRESDENNHYMIFLALDGYVYLQGFVDGKYREMGREYYGKINNIKGEAEIVLVAEGNRISYYVNGKKVYSRVNETFSQGKLGLTLVSGTNKDYGTRCEITNIEVWDLGE